MKRFTILTFIILSLVFLNLHAGEKKEVNKTFKAKELVKIKTVSGDCVIKKGKSSEIKVHVVYTYPADKFEPIFEEEGNTLILKEKFKKKKESITGSSSWTVTVPEKTGIDFSAASGNFSASGLKSDIHAKIASGDVDVNDIKGKLDVNVASGDIDVKNADGWIAVKTASGDIKITGSKGIFKLKSASGSIEAAGIVVKEASVFKGVSGNVSVKLAKGGQYNLDLATVSGNITLDYNGNAVKGYFEFKGQKGNIHSAVPFDNKDTSKYSPFVKKYFKKGGDSPHVSLKTVSGKIEFKK